MRVRVRCPKMEARRTAQKNQRRDTPEQVIRKLDEGEKFLAEGLDLASLVRQLEITESSWHRWRNQYGGMKADDAKKLKELEKKNQRLMSSQPDSCGTGSGAAKS